MKAKSIIVLGPLTIVAAACTAVTGVHGCGGGEGGEDPQYGSTGAGGNAASSSGGNGGIPVGGNGGTGAILGDAAGTGGSVGNHCAGNPLCKEESVGPTGSPPKGFPLPSDQPPPNNVTADGVGRDQNGWLGLDSTQVQADYLWVADDLNYGVGFVSKIRTKEFPTAPKYREVARYVTVTCQSDPVSGSKEGIVLGQGAPGALCKDGKTGCCARDEVVKGPAGGHSAVKVTWNRPSRTAIDFNGDAWVANRAHHGGNEGQSSVTKIANSLSDCVDRNKNGKIETSSDVNNDGIITTDCDGNNLPDDGSTTCKGGKAHEFWGLDDECILFTVNTGQNQRIGRPLALGKGAGTIRVSGPSDAWAGTYNDGTFYRIDGKTGLIKTTVKMNDQGGVQAHPYGAAIDVYGILWAPNIGTSHLFYFDTNNPASQGMVTNPNGGGGFYGIAIDGWKASNPDGGAPIQIQQVWLGEVSGAGAYRYRPARDKGFAGLAQGTWAFAQFAGVQQQGRGIGVDNRTPKAFAWVALDGPAAIGRVPTDIPDGVTKLGPGDVFSTGQQGTLGAGVAFDLDIWGINQGSSSATHFKVDAAGNKIGGPDTVPLDDNPGLQDGHKPHPYTYSDFTGFGLRNFTNPHGTYTWIQPGCKQGQTKWLAVYWDSATPAGTAITLSARSADDLTKLKQAAWTKPYPKSPADLSKAPGPLKPNPADYLEVNFELTTTNELSPKLKSFQITYECVTGTPT